MDKLEAKNSSDKIAKDKTGVIESHKPASQIKSEIEESIGNPFATFMPNRPKFVGYVSDRNFSIYRNGWIRNDFRRHLCFEVIASANGSEIHYKFKTPIYIKVFMTVWLTFVIVGLIVFLVSFFISQPKNPDLLFGVLVTTIMACAGTAMIKWGHLFCIEEEDQALEFVQSIACSDTQRNFS